MAKRFTDTEKWRDDWWGSLPNDYRMIWLYLVDSCSIAGIWKKDFRGLNFNCNTNITEKEFWEVFKGRVVDRNHFYFIPKFIFFQNPKGLNSNKPAVVSIVKELDQNNLIEIIHKLFGNDFLIIKGKGKGIGTGTGKGKGHLPKDEVFESIFADEKFMGDIRQAAVGKDLSIAFVECYAYHTSRDGPPFDIGQWKQKFIGWLSNSKPKAQNGNTRLDAQATLDRLNSYSD